MEFLYFILNAYCMSIIIINNLDNLNSLLFFLKYERYNINKNCDPFQKVIQAYHLKLLINTFLLL